jgi:CRP-like cAMP-binding protein
MNLEHLPIKKYKKGTIILFKGDMADAAYKVKKGCLRSYVIDTNGKEHILQFAPEGWIISDMDAFVNNKAAAIFIDAVEDSEIYELHRDALKEIDNITSTHDFDPNNKIVRNLIATHKRLIALLSEPAENRYLDFLNTYPMLGQRLPLKLIASYIGITPEYLSEIRKKLAGK